MARPPTRRRWPRRSRPSRTRPGSAVQQRIERDHQHLKGRLRPMRGFKTLAGARVLCRAHAFLRNLRGGFYDLGRLVDAAALSPRPPVVQAWAALTGTLAGALTPAPLHLSSPRLLRCVWHLAHHRTTQRNRRPAGRSRARPAPASRRWRVPPAWPLGPRRRAYRRRDRWRGRDRRVRPAPPRGASARPCRRRGRGRGRRV